jgi:hypothetical protein
MDGGRRSPGRRRNSLFCMALPSTTDWSANLRPRRFLICGVSLLLLEMQLNKMTAPHPLDPAPCAAQQTGLYALLQPETKSLPACDSTATTYAADADKHRIVMYRPGQPRAERSIFNEPVNVAIVS